MSRRLLGWSVGMVVFLAWLSLSVSWTLAEPLEIAVDGSEAAEEKKIEEVEQALTRFKNMDFEGALALLEKAVSTHPELPPAPLVMASWFARANQGVATRHWLDRTVKEIPDDPEAYAILGDINLRERRITEAYLLHREALSKLRTFSGSPDRKTALTTRAYGGLASVAESREDWANAQKYLETVLAEDAKNTRALLQLGRVLFRQDKTTEALAKFQAAADLDENVLTPEAQLAQLFERKGDHDNATKYIGEALKGAPKDLPTRLVAIQWLLGRANYQEALRQTGFALTIDPESLDAQNLRGVVSLFLKDYSTAIESFQKVLVKRPSNFLASNNLALALVESDDDALKQSAFEYAKVNVERNGQSAEALSTMGWVLYKIGQVNEAEQMLVKSAQANKGQLSPDTAFYLARVRADQDKKDDAVRLLEGALKATSPFSMRPEAEKLLAEVKPKP